MHFDRNDIGLSRKAGRLGTLVPAGGTEPAPLLVGILRSAIALACHGCVQATGVIKVWNNGSGVPVEMHKKEGVYVPELIFGHLLTSSNYEDDQKKVRTTHRIPLARNGVTSQTVLDQFSAFR